MVGVLNWFLHHWFLIWLLAILGFFDGVRDFFIGMFAAVAAIGDRRHERRVELAQAAAPPSVAKLDPPPAASRPVPGPCAHRQVKQVRNLDGELVAWLCLKLGCEKQLPPDWAVAAEDLP